MASGSDTTAIQNLVDAVQAVLSAGPAAPSPELIESLSSAFSRTRDGVPPQVFFAAVEQAPVAISITDANARILYANPVFEKVTGHRVVDVVGRNESILSDKSTPRQVYEQLWGALLGGRSWTGLLVNRRKDKQRYLAELTVAPVFDSDGKIIHYLGIHRDVTSVYRLEQKVRNQKRLIESIVNAASVPMALMDEDGALVLDNLAYKTLAQDLGTEPVRVILDQLDQPVDFNRPHAGGEAFGEQEISLQTRQGDPRWFVCSGSWLYESDDQATSFFKERERHYLLIVAKEVTRLKQQQEAVRRNALRALVSEEARVQGLREAITGAEYQLQGPFNLLRAAVRMLERKPGHDQSLVQVLHQALNAGGQAMELLRGAVPAETREPVVRVNLNEILHDVLVLSTERLLALGVVVDWQPEHSLPSVAGRENRLRAMAKQLLDNALDALEASGDALREIRISTESDGEMVKMVIADSGPGIPDGIRSRVFEPFFTTRHGSRHVGMGLSMVREILNQHAGTIEILRPGKGCSVRVQLPRTAISSVIDQRQVG